MNGWWSTTQTLAPGVTMVTEPAQLLPARSQMAPTLMFHTITRWLANTVSGGVRIPVLNSFLTGGSRSTFVQGLDAAPAGNRPSNVNCAHWAFDVMVGIARLLVPRSKLGENPATSRSP